ncbi:MAG: DUF4340 domain-containing protein [Spirochaetaceae bacterium]|jgi:hypothetical protein|nr:DUF4340 domain-containing protein [Spirochaetaceae bacterium]
MPYKKKVLVLSSIAGALFIIYVLSFVFSGESRARRTARWAPLASKTAQLATKVVLKGSEGEVKLEKDGEIWQVRVDDELFPAKQARIDDFFAALTATAEYPVRATSENAGQKLGFDEAADKITIYEGETTSIELVFGTMDATGKEIYLRSGDGPIRSGIDNFTVYLGGAAKAWFDLALFNSTSKPAVDSIQRMVVTFSQEPDAAKPSPTPYTLVRTKDGWQFESGEKADTSTVDATIRFILDAQGDDFMALSMTPAGADFSGKYGQVLLETGDNTSISVILGQQYADKKMAKTSGRDYIYALSDWTIERIWQDKTKLAEKKE